MAGHQIFMFHAICLSPFTAGPLHPWVHPQRAASTMPLYIRDLSICRILYGVGECSWDQCPQIPRDENSFLNNYLPSRDSRARTRSPSPRAWRPDFPGAAREAP